LKQIEDPPANDEDHVTGNPNFQINAFAFGDTGDIHGR